MHVMYLRKVYVYGGIFFNIITIKVDVLLESRDEVLYTSVVPSFNTTHKQLFTEKEKFTFMRSLPKRSFI